MYRPGEIRAGNPIRIPDGHPVFCEGYVLPRFKECICLLISEEARLQLDIGAIVVRECVAPIKAVRVNTPGPNFLSRQVGIAGKVHSSGACSGMPDAHEVFPASMDEQ